MPLERSEEQFFVRDPRPQLMTPEELRGAFCDALEDAIGPHRYESPWPFLEAKLEALLIRERLLAWSNKPRGLPTDLPLPVPQDSDQTPLPLAV